MGLTAQTPTSTQALFSEQPEFAQTQQTLAHTCTLVAGDRVIIKSEEFT